MDGNKDEALKCIKIAESSLQLGDEQRALKFVKIAKRLDPTIRTDHILSAIENLNTLKPTPKRESHQVPQRTPQQETSSSINYTEEHVRVVREIRKNEDYYAILGIEKSSDAEEIKRAYRKLSLKVHPDKNNAPGAEEAFKSVSKAFYCLSNEQSRRNYDLAGNENHSNTIQNENFARRPRTTARDDFFEEDFDPYEIFSSFFFDSQGGVYNRGDHHRQRNHCNCNATPSHNPIPNPNPIPDLFDVDKIVLPILIGLLAFFIASLFLGMIGGTDTGF